MLKNITVVLLASIAPIIGYSQALWQELSTPPIEASTSNIQATSAKYYTLNEPVMQQVMQRESMSHSMNDTFEMELPTPEGGFMRFRMWETYRLKEPLKSRYPLIRTYKGRALDGNRANAYLDFTYTGFRAMVLMGENTWFIDPVNHLGIGTSYVVYYKRYFTPSADKAELARCLVESGNSDNGVNPSERSFKTQISNGTVLRDYTIAVACTGEYATFHGGTKTGALSGIVTSINRVSGVYEDELAIKFTLVGNNDTVIFLNAGTDPFNNNNAGTLINQSQTIITQYIGSANFDIGHTFSTGGGGLAGLGVICNNNSKARGITGSSSPVNDPYDIDYVAHEIGHQFGGSHTFNGSQGSCAGGNRSSNNAYEPGSGTTIMAYAGICGSHNTQSNSDAYFHIESLRQMYNHAVVGSGNGCASRTPTNNQPPTFIRPIADTFFIPKSTPFELVGNGNDSDGDSITYCWEQYDLGPAGAPTNPTGNAPSFRSFNPTTNPIRTFPRLQNILLNNTSVGEVMASYGRSMKFRLTLRDNQANGGGMNFSDDAVLVNVDGVSGPFQITSQNTPETWQSGSQVIINWNVAGSDQAPVNCQNVMILFSSDAGQTFPDTLRYSTPNDGVDTIFAPATLTTLGRIKIKGLDNVFFDINNRNIVVQCSDQVSLLKGQSDTTLCEGADFNALVRVVSLSNLPLNYTWLLNGAPISVPADSVINFTGVTTNQAGNYQVSIKSNCSTPISTGFALNVLPVPDTAMLELRNDSLFVNNAGTYTVNWYRNGVLIPNFNSTALKLDSAGRYQVIVLNGDCESDTIQGITWSPTIMVNPRKDFAKVYPNPSNGQFRLEFENPGTTEAKLMVTNSIGQVMQTFTLKLNNGRFSEVIDLNDFRNGLYFLSIYYENALTGIPISLY